MELTGKTIAITGATGGIGALLCQRFLDLDANIIMIGRTKIQAQDAQFIQGDLSNIEGINQVISSLKNHDIDILINLAGLQYFGPAEQESITHTQSLLTVNLMAPIMLTQALLPKMKQKKSGHIVNIGSTFGSINFAHFASYSSSKSGLKGFSEALRREVKSDGINITYIAPRAVNTPMNTSKLLNFASMTKMNMDEPSWVADKILNAIIDNKKDIYLGFPEKLFVRINAIFPRLVDWSLAENDQKAKKLF